MRLLIGGSIRQYLSLPENEASKLVSLSQKQYRSLSEKINAIIENRAGNCREQALLITNRLRSRGIDSRVYENPYHAFSVIFINNREEYIADPWNGFFIKYGGKFAVYRHLMDTINQVSF